jgi:hypothetical protein
MTRRTIAALVLVLALSGPVQAAQLFSPPLFPDADSNLECVIVNVSEVIHAVTITALNSDGTTAATQFLTLLPLQTGSHLETTSPTATACQFTVDGEKTDYRAAVCVVVAAHTAGQLGRSCLPAN